MQLQLLLFHRLRQPDFQVHQGPDHYYFLFEMDKEKLLQGIP